MQCECGCGWEGEDEVTQWLIEEAVAFAGRASVAKSPEERAADELAERHAEMVALRDRMRSEDGVR